MFAALRRRWRTFRSAPAGRRFQQRYRRRAPRAGALRKGVVMCVAIAMLAAGIALLVLPGPGVLVIVLAAALIAGESLVAARILDRVDLWIARCLRRGA